MADLLRNIKNKKAIRNFRFPYSYEKANDLTGRKERITLDVLRKSHMPTFKKHCDMWAGEVKRLYSKDPNLCDLNLDDMYNAETPVDREGPFVGFSGSVNRIMIMALSENAVEGYATMNIYTLKKHANLSFIGLSPWNVFVGSVAPRFSGLSWDFMTAAFLVSLNNAQYAKNDAKILSMMFVSERGKSFGKRFYNITENLSGFDMFGVNVKKAGVLEYLTGDHKIQNNNIIISYHP